MQLAEPNNFLSIGACTTADLTDDVILDIRIDAVTACLRICANQVVEGMTEIHHLAGVLDSLDITENEGQDKALRAVYKLVNELDALQIVTA